MAFNIRKHEQVGDAVRRIALEQIEGAIRELEDDNLDPHSTVHQVRKRCKKLRGLVRLVRPQFENTYKTENAWYRDAARTLSYQRDAQSMIDTLDGLIDHFADPIEQNSFAGIREKLVERRKSVARDDAGLEDTLAEFRERMLEGRERVATWQLKDEGFEAVSGGLGKTYARGRTAMLTALKKPSAEAFHEWRKRAKYHWYHVRLLQSVWAGPMKARRGEAKVLSDLIGDDHDLAILYATVIDSSDNFGDEKTLQTLAGLIDRRQAELRAKAIPLGARLYVERPKRFVSRMESYWTAG